MKQNSKLFTQCSIGKAIFKNRILFPSMCVSYCDDEGNFTNRYMAFILERVRSGIGGIIVPGSIYGKRGLWRASFDDDMFIPGWTKLAEEVHRYDVKLICQLHPSGFDPPRVKDRNNPSEYSAELIEELVEGFAKTAYRCKQAGIDGVEIHGAHAHEVAAFSSPYFNKRTDEYGGNYTGRAKFGLDIIRKIRLLCGDDYPLIYRMSGEDKIEGGSTIDESAKVAQLFEAAGANAIHVSAGIAPSKQYSFATMDLPECLLVEDAACVKAGVNIPVIAVNRIMDMDQAASVIDENKADMVAMGRAFLADPQLIYKALGENDIPVTRCLGCKPSCHMNNDRTCIQNPMIGRESELQ